jgi:hypothetical protein
MTSRGDDAVTRTTGTMLTLPLGHQVTGRNARFVWERALRDGGAPRYLMGFLLLIGTYMNNDGTNAMPSVPTLATQFALSQQRVFELFKEAETTGWLITRKRPGKPSERLPATPTPFSGQLTLLVTPDVTPQMGLMGTPQTHLRGQEAPDPDPSDPSETTPQTHLRGGGYPSDGSETTEEIRDP